MKSGSRIHQQIWRIAPRKYRNAAPFQCHDGFVQLFEVLGIQRAGRISDGLFFDPRMPVVARSSNEIAPAVTAAVISSWAAKVSE